ncbi:MAG: nitroreductase family protein [Spirochaetaceae bacterium]
MESFNSVLHSRRSIRAYKETSVDLQDVKKMIDAALHSPTAKNIPGVHIVVIDDREKLKTLSKCKPHGADFVADAPLAFVVAGDTDKSVAWIEDASITCITLQYSAEELGLSSCWAQIRERKTPEGGSSSEYIKTECGLPGNFEVEAIIAVGYPDEKVPPRSEDELPLKNVHHNSFEKPFFS